MKFLRKFKLPWPGARCHRVKAPKSGRESSLPLVTQKASHAPPLNLPKLKCKTICAAGEASNILQLRTWGPVSSVFGQDILAWLSFHSALPRSLSSPHQIAECSQSAECAHSLPFPLRVDPEASYVGAVPVGRSPRFQLQPSRQPSFKSRWEPISTGSCESGPAENTTRACIQLDSREPVRIELQPWHGH